MARKQSKLTITGKSPSIASIIVDMNISMGQVRNVIMLTHTIEAKKEFAAIKKEVAILRNKKKSLSKKASR